jgi:hypothetical protein
VSSLTYYSFNTGFEAHLPGKTRMRSQAGPGDIKHSVADISPAGKVLGYVLEVELKTGLKKIIKIK